MNKFMKHQKLQFKPGSFRLNGLFRVVFLICCLLSAGLTQAQEKKITAEFKDTPLSNVLKQLEKLSTYKILFTYDDVQSYKVTVSLKDATITEALQKVLDGKPFVFSDVANGKYISVVYQPKKKSETTKEIKGKVVDSKGETVIGATVRVVNATIGTATDIDGNFTLRVPENVMTLEIGVVGMKTQLVSIKDKTEVRVVMEEDNTVLEDVVVTGIFKKAKESYTGAVSSINAEQLKMYKGQNVLQTLKNIDASLNFTVNNAVGSNPNAVPQINIRGNSSLPISVQEYNESASNAVNTPLIIRDGFEISLEQLMDYNDDEIESINILKDAAATAIYGSRGSNGVIVVITKQPEAGKLRVNVEVGMDLEIPDLSSYDLLNAAQKLELERSLGLYDNTVAPSNDVWYKKAYYKRLRDVLSGTDTDWLSKPLHTGVGTHYNLRMEGGSEQFRWGVSAAYKDIQGAMKESSRRNFNGSVTLMYQMKKLIFRNYSSYTTNEGKESKYGNFSDYVKQQPYNAAYDQNGKLVRYFDGFHKATGKSQNPLYDATLNSFDKSGYQALTNNFSVEWKPTEELTLRGQVGISGKNTTNDAFLPAEHSTFTEDEYYSTDEGFLRRGIYTYSPGRTSSYDGNLTLAYNKVFHDKHQVYVGLDYSLSESRSYSYRIVAEGFTNEDINFLGSARQYAKDEGPGGSKMKTRRMGLTGNANYIFDNRYYVDLSYRMDGSSTFGSKKKYAQFWSSGIGWNIHNEKFFSNDVVNTLRLKASYGETGTQQGSSSGASTIYKYITDNRYMHWTGAVLQGWGNPYLTWQKTNEFNIGTEVGLLQGRVKGEFNFYTKRTGNLLSNMDLPHSMGFSSYVSNVGEVKNRGWEASATGYLIRDTEREINWMIGGQLVYNKNYISKLSEAVKAQNEAYLKEDVDVANLFYEGRPQHAIYAVRSFGIDPSTGKEVFLDKNGKETDIWNASDKVYLGSKDPKFRGNFNTMFMWKGFTLNMSFGFYWGGKVYNQTLIDRVEVTRTTLMSQNVDARVYKDRWQKPGDVVSFKKFDNTATRATSRFVMDDNVFELQSVALQYKWDEGWLHKHTPISSVIFSVNMSDLFHFSTVKMERGTSYPYARNILGSVKFLF